MKGVGGSLSTFRGQKLFLGFRSVFLRKNRNNEKKKGGSPGEGEAGDRA